jgi:hypothetical protein
LRREGGILDKVPTKDHHALLKVVAGRHYFCIQPAYNAIRQGVDVDRRRRVNARPSQDVRVSHGLTLLYAASPRARTKSGEPRLQSFFT